MRDIRVGGQRLEYPGALLTPDPHLMDEAADDLGPSRLVAVRAIAGLRVDGAPQHHDGGVADPLELGASDHGAPDVIREQQAVPARRVDGDLRDAGVLCAFDMDGAPTVDAVATAGWGFVREEIGDVGVCDGQVVQCDVCDWLRLRAHLSPGAQDTHAVCQTTVHARR